ncbi:MAG: tRNA (adenosine(37)-N6)-dimethylallyltransferase MiaA [Ignavibacteriae bacterium]|nr:tRNA (adenosine(37)-N6)-dimethylallyltransferase MiaA [Ignavibacteriota bacterium]
MRKYIAITGPTASGKTSLAIELAKVLETEIVSADSRQIYKNIPIATATPSLKERQGIKHYFLEEIELDRLYNAGEYGRDARKIVENIFDKGKVPVVIGGSGLYLQALIDGFFEQDVKDREIRKKLNEEMAEHGKEYLFDKLKQVDPESAEKMAPHYFRRVIRALEVYYASGKKISELQKNNLKADFEAVQFGIMMDREYLYERINKRVDMMIEEGLVKEAEALKEKGFHPKTHNSLNTVGIKEVFMYFDGEYTYDEMIFHIKQNSRRFAKRQMTWFRRDERINWLEADENTDAFGLANRVIEIFTSKK